MGFPQVRMRRLRANALLRSFAQETRLTTHDFIMPLFICSGAGIRMAIESMPGVYRFSIDLAIEECRRIRKLGIHAILLFAVSEQKDETGKVGYDDNGLMQQAIRSIKENLEDLLIITDVCNCAYTSHGHCGVVVNGKIDNDSTLEILARQALSHARAGSDMVAPSDMMDGRIEAIRKALDNGGFYDLPIMSYSVKYASAFYGPFRMAADCAPKFGDRKTYQMNPANSNEAIRESALDVEEGADVLMVKPALSYLDIIYRVKNEFNLPVVAFNVSGEYSIVKAASEKGLIDEKRTIMEILTSIKRAGADMIITYHAAEAAEILQKTDI